MVLLGLSMGTQRKFDVFGKVMLVEASAVGWQLFILGNEGKRLRSDMVIPDFIREDELAQYLDDMFHEMATRERPSVIRLPS